MCNDMNLFSGMKHLRRPQEVTLGDGHVLEATAEGTVTLEMLLPDGSTKSCSLTNVLYVPKLSYIQLTQCIKSIGIKLGSLTCLIALVVKF